MDQFTAKKALLTGAELIRRRPLLIALWMALLLAQTVFFVAIRAKLFGEVQAGAGFTPRALGPLFNYTLGAAALSLALAALLWTSAFRAILRPEDQTALALGLEELCVFVSWLIINLLVAIAGTPLSIALISGFPGPGTQAAPYAPVVLEVLGLLWSAVASVWAFDRRRLALLRCWSIARGHVWLLIGLVVGVALLDQLANAGVRQLAPPLGLFPSVQDLLKAPSLLQDALRALIGALEIAFVAGVVATAYRAASKPQAATFSSVVNGPAS